MSSTRMIGMGIVFQALAGMVFGLLAETYSGRGGVGPAVPPLLLGLIASLSLIGWCYLLIGLVAKGVALGNRESRQTGAVSQPRPAGQPVPR